MIESPLVSIIVPVYGVEKFIKKCLESVLAQSYANFECLIVDDGSVDDSIKIAKDTVGHDDRFVFLHKENGGQGSARNLGLDTAAGEYVAFLDSDDYYEPEYLSLLVAEIEKTDSDICVCNSRYVTLSGEIVKIYYNDLEGYYKNQDYFISRGYISNFMWDKLFRKSCFDGLRFDPTVRTYEDVHLLFRVLYNKKAVSVNHILYNYVQRPGSTMHSLPKTYLYDRHRIFQAVDDFYKNKFIKNEAVRRKVDYYFFNNFIFYAIVTISRYSKNFNHDAKELIEISKLSWGAIREVFSGSTRLPLKVKTTLVLFKFSPYLCKLFVISWLTMKNSKVAS